MIKFFKELEQLLNEDREVVLVSVIDSCGSTPRGAGAKMLVDKSGRISGTIGGGSVEHESEKFARILLCEQKSTVKKFILVKNSIADIGMVCGGDVTVHFKYLSFKDTAFRDTLSNCINLLSQNKELIFSIDLISNNISCDNIVGFEDVKFTKIRGNEESYHERLNGNHRVYIFGGGHVAQELVPVLEHLSFSCIVLENRPELADKKYFPLASQVILANYGEISNYINICENDYIVAMTHGHAADTLVLSQVLHSKAHYIGAIGSQSKKKAVEQKLLDMGFNTEDLKRVITPIGLDIKAETPGEIAISVAAQLITVRSEKTQSNE